MKHVFSSVAPRAVALAGTLLVAAACTTSLKVGTDNSGGAGGKSVTSGNDATGTVTSTGSGTGSCSTVADCPITPGGAGCASTCADGSNPCATACVGGMCVDKGCPDGGAGAGGSTGTGVGGAGGGCSGAHITVQGDGVAKQYDFVCKGSYGVPYTMDANGHFGVPGPHLGPTSVDVDGCATAGADPLLGSIELEAPLAMAGTSTAGTVTFDDGTDTYGNSGTATVTVLGDTAGTLTGTFSAAVQPTNGNGVTNISGTFKVCHVSDFFPP